MATTPVFLPGKFHRQRRLEGYNPWGHKELNMTEHTQHNGNTQKISPKKSGLFCDSNSSPGQYHMSWLPSMLLIQLPVFLLEESRVDVCVCCSLISLHWESLIFSRPHSTAVCKFELVMEPDMQASKRPTLQEQQLKIFFISQRRVQTIYHSQRQCMR